jgi:hypothetical protein
MSLPRQLLYENKINSSYSRNYNAVIQPVNSSDYGLGQTCIINIPCDSQTCLSGADSVLSMRLKLASGEQSVAYFNKCGIAGCIQRLRIYNGSQLLQDIDNYQSLASLLTPFQSSSDEVTGRSRVLAGTNEGRGDLVTTGRGAGDAVERDFTFPLLSIMSMTDNYVPLWAMSGVLRVEIQFVSSIAKFINSTVALGNPATGANSIFSDVKFVGNFMELSNTAMEIIQNSLQGRAVEWVTKSYSNYVYNGILGTGTTSVSIPVNAKYNSLCGLYVIARSHPDGLVNANPRFADDTPNFDIQEYSFRLGSKVLPSEKPNTLTQMLANMEQSLGSVSNRHTPHSYSLAQITNKTPSTDQSVSNAFCVGLELESYSSTELSSKVYQGYNSASEDVFALLTYNGQGQATAVRWDVFASYDQLIVIDNGQISVQY